LKREDVTEEKLTRSRMLNELAASRGQTLAQLAIAWTLRKPPVVSALIGVSKAEQIDDIAGFLRNPDLTENELNRIEDILGGSL
jgi:L-glyceraldehyde 3-phosphate reductase